MVMFALQAASAYAQTTPKKSSGTQAPDQTPTILDSLKAPNQLPLKDSLSINSTSNFPLPKDTTKVDSIQPKKSALSAPVHYLAEDSMVFDVAKNQFFLFRKAKVENDDMTLDAGLIDLNWKTSIVNARPIEDSTGKEDNIPLFSQGADKYQAKRIKFNFNTKKGLITGIVTQQGEGYMHGERVKRLPNADMYVQNARYTTCNLEHPHFYIEASKIKMIPNDKLITGPFNLVIADAPTPLGFLFGLFPVPKKGSSGIIIPTYGDSFDRGFFLRNGGYYFPIGDYAGVKLLGEIYTKGSYGYQALTNYRVRYKFDGNLEYRYNRRMNGQEGFEDVAEDFWFSWRHTPLTNGDSRFSASVDLGSTNFNALNSFNPQNYLSSNFNSNVMYSKTFTGTPFNLSVTANQSQNVAPRSDGTRQNVMTASLPQVGFFMNRINPFRKETGSGKTWYEKLNIAYNLTASNELSNRGRQQINAGAPVTIANQISARQSDSILPISGANIPQLLANGRFGMRHSIPISTALQAFKYLNLSPSVNYNEIWAPWRYNYTYVPGTNSVRADTVREFSRAYSFDARIESTTRLYGMFYIRQGRLEAIRHVMVPTLGFTFLPDFSDPNFGIYQTVQVDTLGNTRRLNPFSGGLYGIPGAGRTGNITFSLTNTFEAKVRKAVAKDSSKTASAEPKKDKDKFEKVMILDALGINGSYNIFRDSLRLSNFNVNARTRLLNTIDLNFFGNLDPYQRQRNARGDLVVVDRYTWQNGSLPRLTNFNLSIGTSFNPKGTQAKKREKAKALEALDPSMTFLPFNQDLYVDFSIPWNLGVNFIYVYSNPTGERATVTRNISLNGDINITEKWKIGGNTGYDLDANRFTFTNLNVYRDLHCWEIRFNWIPFGFRQMYTVDINVKASILQDLKLSRNRSWYDR